LQAKSGKEEEVRNLLASALTVANREATTPVWCQAHLAGDIARA
jgi:hypothetical protein